VDLARYDAIGIPASAALYQ